MKFLLLTLLHSTCGSEMQFAQRSKRYLKISTEFKTHYGFT